MRVASLFSGCGGMDLGAEMAGCQIVFANDSMPQAAATHQRYFPGTGFVDGPIADISDFPEVDLLTGGYPCQSFSMGGKRNPEDDDRTQLYRHFARYLDQASPKFFIAENVSGLQALRKGRFLDDQLELFSKAGSEGGYRLALRILRAEEYGIPQRRKRLFIVGVRQDLGQHYHFPPPTHARADKAAKLGLEPWASHGECIRHLPLWPSGEFYERPHDPDGHFAWYYMSRNRKAPWDGPAFTVVANWRHVTLHPASETMSLTWSNLADGWKQRWDFSGEFEHLGADPKRPALEEPRRLSWRECAAIQTFPVDFEPAGDTERKFEQIGNAVPPRLAEQVIRPLVSGDGLHEHPSEDAVESPSDQLQLA